MSHPQTDPLEATPLPHPGIGLGIPGWIPARFGVDRRAVRSSDVKRLSKAYPFTAILWRKTMKRALLCAVVNPGLHGVLVRGERGTAKSTAARALAALMNRRVGGGILAQGAVELA